MHGSFLDAAVEHLALADMDRLLGLLGLLMQRLHDSEDLIIATLHRISRRGIVNIRTATLLILVWMLRCCNAGTRLKA